MYLPLTRRQRLNQAINRIQGLVAHYQASEIEGSVAQNYAPANIGSLSGTISGASLGFPATLGRAYSFDGVNDKVTLPLLITRNNTLTLLAVFQTNDKNENQQTIISNGIGTAVTGRGVAIVISGNASVDGSLYVLDHVIKWVDTGYDIPNNNPHFLALVLNASGNPTIYIDGVQVYTSGSVTTSNPLVASFFGSDSVGGWLNGYVKNAAWVGRIMTASEILELAKIGGFA